MKKILFAFFAELFLCNAYAQLTVDGTGSSLTIENGTYLHVHGITLIPSEDFILSNVVLYKLTIPLYRSPINPNYISRLYHFSNTSNPFSGSINIEYTDDELNGISEEDLHLNNFSFVDSTWALYHPTVRDSNNNYVLTDGLDNINLKEVSLVELFGILPLTWLSFTAIAQNNGQSLLEWATAQERNTKEFHIQHSADGINWVSIGSLPATGNSNTTRHYKYLHAKPVNGLNYYRIKQTDADSRYSFSPVRKLSFITALQPLIILGNPVTNDVLTLQVNIATSLSFYTADGKLLWQEKVNAGTKNIDVSPYAKGIYLLKTTTTTQKVVIQ